MEPPRRTPPSTATCDESNLQAENGSGEWTLPTDDKSIELWHTSTQPSSDSKALYELSAVDFPRQTVLTKTEFTKGSTESHEHEESQTVTLFDLNQNHETKVAIFDLSAHQYLVPNLLMIQTTGESPVCATLQGCWSPSKQQTAKQVHYNTILVKWVIGIYRLSPQIWMSTVGQRWALPTTRLCHTRRQVTRLAQPRLASSAGTNPVGSTTVSWRVKVSTDTYLTCYLLTYLAYFSVAVSASGKWRN